MYWYPHGGGWSTQLTGGAEGAGLAQPPHKKGKWWPALVFNHLDRGLEKMEPDPSQKRAVKDWRSVHKSQQGKLELGTRWGKKKQTKHHEKPKLCNGCPKRLWSLHHRRCSVLSWTSPSASGLLFEASPALSSRLDYLTLPVVPSSLNYPSIWRT